MASPDSAAKSAAASATSAAASAQAAATALEHVVDTAQDAAAEATLEAKGYRDDAAAIVGLPTEAAAQAYNIENDAGVKSALSASIGYGRNVARTLGRFRNGDAVKAGVLGDSKLDPSTTGNTAGTATAKALALIDAWSTSTVTTTNVADSGHTMARQFIEGDVTTVAAAKPHVVFIEIGTNDSNSDENGPYAAGYPMADSLAAVERACAYVRDGNEGCEFVFIATTPYLTANTPSNAKIAAYNAGLKALAAVVGAEVVDGYAAFQEYADANGSWDSLLLDSTHRNAAGNDVLAAAIAEHFPQTGLLFAPALAPRAVRGKYDTSRVDSTKGNYGYLTLAAPAVAAEGSYVLTGTGWAVEGSFDVTSTIGDTFELTGTKAIDLMASVDLGSASVGTAYPVVDVHLDGALVAANVDLHAQSGKNSTNYWVPFLTGLDGGTHTLRLTLKSGMLRIASAAILVAGSGGSFAPETRLVTIPVNATSTLIPSDGSYVAAVLDTVISKPSGWGSYDLIVRGVVSNRVNGATTTVRQIHTRLRLASTASQSFLNDFDAVPTGETRYRQVPVVQTATDLTGNTQLRLDGRVLSTDKTNAYLAGYVLDAVLIRKS